MGPDVRETLESDAARDIRHDVLSRGPYPGKELDMPGIVPKTYSPNALRLRSPPVERGREYAA